MKTRFPGVFIRHLSWNQPGVDLLENGQKRDLFDKWE